MSDIATIHIIRLTPANIESAQILFRAVHGRKLPEGFLARKYNTGYTGVSYLGYLAFNEKQLPVAFFAVIPMFVGYEGEKLLAAQAVDGMTHPAYRNKGLFYQLVTRTIRLCAENQIRFCFGFPNQQSLPVFQKLQWQITVQMSRFEIPVKKNPAAVLARKFLPHKWRLLQIEKQLKKHGRLLDSRTPFYQHTKGVCRNAAYMEYKTCHRTWQLATGDGVVWFTTGRTLTIGDIAADTQNVAAVLAGLKKIAEALGLQQLVFHCTNASPMYACFSRFCKPLPSFPVVCYTDTDWDLQKMVFTSADLDTF